MHQKHEGLGLMDISIPKYQNKEKESTFNLRRIDFGARSYNASIGRFDRVDVFANVFEQISPYNYVLNNPLIYRDPKGDSTVHINKLNWQKFDPSNDDILLDAAVVKPTSVGTQVMEEVSGFWGWTNQIWNGNRRYYDGREVDSDGILTNRIKPIMGTPPSFSIATKASTIAWSSARLGRLAKELLSGKLTIKVANRAEAEELFLRLFQGKGYKNSTGMSATEAKNFFGKGSTYHWDDAVDETGQIINHSSTNAHGAMKHLQIHDELGNIIRIFFE